MYSIAQTQKFLIFMSYTGECRNKNTPSMHHPQRRNVTISMVASKTVTYAKISPKLVNPRDIAEHTEEDVGSSSLPLHVCSFCVVKALTLDFAYKLFNQTLSHLP